MIRGKIRIPILDGFRAIAIISVMLYHYFSRWKVPINNISLYPYKDKFDYFNWGQQGVSFFFIISGFVIYFTLEKSDNFTLFWKKRTVRLLPSVIIASCITFIFFNLFDHETIFPNSHQLKNFIPSVSFIEPSLLQNIFDTEIEYINGSYWSLWPEIQFYAFVSLIYFINKKKFLKNFIFITFPILTINIIVQKNELNHFLPKSLLNWYYVWISNGFNLSHYLKFFGLGVLFYQLYKDKSDNKKTSLFIKVSLLFMFLYILYTGYILSVRITYILMFYLFYLFLYRSHKINFIGNHTFTSIGESSYFLYLIHENIGVFIIYSVGSILPSNAIILPILLILSFSYLSILFFKNIDSPINRWLKGVLLKKTLLQTQ